MQLQVLSLIKNIFSFLAGLIGAWHDRKVEQATKASLEAQEDAVILKGVKNANDLRDKPDLPDSLLISPDQRGHNND